MPLPDPNPMENQLSEEEALELMKQYDQNPQLIPQTTRGSMNLISKLAEVLGAVGRVPKRGRNEYHKYDYVKEDDLVEAVRGELSQRGIFVFTSVVSEEKSGTLTKVILEHTFTDGIDMFTVRSIGYGDDKADKGVYKALTGAVKYFLMKNFLIPTGDDPEADHNDRAREEEEKKARNSRAKSQPAATQGQTRPSPSASPTGANPAPTGANQGGDPESVANRQALAAMFREDFGDDRKAIEERLGQITEVWVGRRVTKFKDLSEAEAEAMIQQVTAGKLVIFPAGEGYLK